MEQRGLFDSPDARTQRDDALAKVSRPSWLEEAVASFTSAAPTGEFTGEELRTTLLAAGLTEPHHHNAWGALVMTLVRRKLIQATGAYRAMSTTRSHARKTPVYKRAGITETQSNLSAEPPPTRRRSL